MYFKTQGVKMGWMKRWLWELIENGEVKYLITMGAPKWAIEEAEFYAKKDLDYDDKSTFTRAKSQP